MNSKMIMIYFMFILLYSLKLKNFLMVLISIELLMLNTACFMLLWLIFLEIEFYIIYFLVIMVSESVLGLTLLIMMMRIYGNDSLNLFNSQW